MSFPSRSRFIWLLFCLISISRIRHVALKKKQFALLLLHHEYTAKKVSSDQKRRNRSQNLLFRFFSCTTATWALLPSRVRKLFQLSRILYGSPCGMFFFFFFIILFFGFIQITGTGNFWASSDALYSVPRVRATTRNIKLSRRHHHP